MNRFDAVICDMDGLLLDSERIALDTFLETCEQVGLGDETDLFIRLIGTNAQQGRRILREGLEGKTEHEVFDRKWKETYDEVTRSEPIPLKDGVIELLDHVKSLDLPMAVATSTGTDRAEEKLRHSGILAYFSLIVGGDRVVRSKPNPDIYVKAAECLNVDPRKCLALEDSENGVKSALEAGLTVIQIPDLVEPSQDMGQLGHIILDSLKDVPCFKF
jgi:HAD superfamily hydrolase (TIGR01509 family)